jgi:hypothetical protein
MKKTFLFTVINISIFLLHRLIPKLVKPGTKLIYAVETNEQKYDFIITIKTRPCRGIRLGNDRSGK